jgi:DNA-binding MarR family transcriptional regulator
MVIFHSAVQPSREAPFLRGQVSITDLDLMLYLSVCGRTLGQVAEFLQVTKPAANVYLSRLRERNFLQKHREADGLVYELSSTGKEFLRNVRERIGNL